MAPVANEVPSNMLLRHVFPTPISVMPASPSVHSPIMAALRFCLHLKYSADGKKIRAGCGGWHGCGA